MSRKYFPELDGIRAIAVLSVISFHASSSVPGESILATALGVGWAGVDLFFVLSGFLITGILLDTKTSPRALGNFYARRVLRIFPLYYASLLVIYHLMPALHRLKNAPEEWWYWLYVSNWSPSTGTAHAWLTHFWSLAIEEQFYLMWPFVVLALSWRRAFRASMLLAASGLVARSAGSLILDPLVIYRNTLFRVDSLAIGAVAAFIARDPAMLELVGRRRRLLVATAGICLAACLAASGGQAYTKPMYTIGFTLWGILFGNLVLWATTAHRTQAHAILRSALLGRIGKHSYAMYVVHVPVVAVVIRTLRPAASSAGVVQTVAASVGLSFLVALVT